MGQCVDDTNATRSRDRAYYMIGVALICCGGAVLITALLVHIYTSSTVMNETWYLALLVILGYVPLAFGAVLWRYVALQVRTSHRPHLPKHKTTLMSLVQCVCVVTSLRMLHHKGLGYRHSRFMQQLLLLPGNSLTCCLKRRAGRYTSRQ